MTELKLLSRDEFAIRWVDLDAYNHLNNARYYDFMTESRAKNLVNFVHECNFVVVENGCKYKAPIGYPNTIIVEQYIQNTTASCFECVYLVKSGSDEKLCAEGFAKIVCVHPERKKACKIPEKLKKFFLNLPDKIK